MPPDFATYSVTVGVFCEAVRRGNVQEGKGRVKEERERAKPVAIRQGSEAGLGGGPITCLSFQRDGALSWFAKALGPRRPGPFASHAQAASWRPDAIPLWQHALSK